jgi:hypothetical protein
MKTREGGRDAHPTAGETPALQKPVPVTNASADSPSDRSAGVPPPRSPLDHGGGYLLRNRALAAWAWDLGLGGNCPDVVAPGTLDRPDLAALDASPTGGHGRACRNSGGYPGGPGQWCERSAVCGDRRSCRSAHYPDRGASGVEISAAGLYTFSRIRYREAAADKPPRTSPRRNGYRDRRCGCRPLRPGRDAGRAAFRSATTIVGSTRSSGS